MKKNRFTYYVVIQSNHGNGWDDESHYETNSTGYMSREERKLLRHDLKEYRLAYQGTGAIRTVRRKELN